MATLPVLDSHHSANLTRHNIWSSLSTSCIHLPFSVVIVIWSFVLMGMVAVLVIAPPMLFFASPVISLHFYTYKANIWTYFNATCLEQSNIQDSLSRQTFQSVSNSFAVA